MDIENQLRQRAASKCELCSSDQYLSVFEVRQNARKNLETSVLLCAVCLEQMSNSASMNISHWYCLRESMWNENTAVKVLVYRLLKSMGDKPWAHDLLGQIYLDPETQTWADAEVIGASEEDNFSPVRDSNGIILNAGDSVTLIKDLDVKGMNFTAKRGTTVKNIHLTDDPRYVEGRLNGVQIVLVAAFLKKV